MDLVVFVRYEAYWMKIIQIGNRRQLSHIRWMNRHEKCNSVNRKQEARIWITEAYREGAYSKVKFSFAGFFPKHIQSYLHRYPPSISMAAPAMKLDLSLSRKLTR